MLPAACTSPVRTTASADFSGGAGRRAVGRAGTRIRLDWPPSRIALTNRLWGPGFIFPGGEMETLRLTRPMGAAASASLLVVGIGAGGPASAITRNFGAWVTGLDNDPGLLASARTFINKAQLTKKIRIEAWNPRPGVRPEKPPSLPGVGTFARRAA